VKKIKLSDLISLYDQKLLNRDEFFAYYFEENELDIKASRLKFMYDALGDVVLPIDYFKVFLYSGHWYGQKDYFKLTKPMIKDVYEIIKDYDDMPLFIVDKLLFYYDEPCFKEYPVKEYFNALISKYKFTEGTITRYSKYISELKSKIKQLYKEESSKLEDLKAEYGYEFIHGLQNIIKREYIKADEVLKLIPSKRFIDESRVKVPIGYSILSGEDIVSRILLGYVDLDKFEDDETIVLGPCSMGGYVKTSFTKKEYLEEIGQKQKKKTK